MKADAHFERLLRWLDLEARAEAEKSLADSRRLRGAAAERTGNTLVGLVIREDSAGLAGRVLLSLGKRDPSQPFPWTRLGVGSPVLLSEEQGSGETGWRGVVSRRSESAIEIALARWPDLVSDRPTFRVDLAGDEAARQRQRAALGEARAARRGRVAELRDVLLGIKAPSFASDSFPPLEFSAAINNSQRLAIEFALGAEHIAVIHGPPGTGKTTTLTTLIREAAARGKKVLATAPSNLAVDNLLERLLAAGERAVRLGHPARVLHALRDATLDYQVEAHPDVKLARKLVREARALREKAGKYTRSKPAPGARSELRAEASALIADARRIEAQTIEEILRRATVVCCTLTALDSAVLGELRFDLAVIDEACQSTEPACWIPLLRSERVILAGDHCQLPPTVISTEAAREGLAVSLLERLIGRYGGAVCRRLDVQYRMHRSIMEFSSREFYEGALTADESVGAHTLADLPGVAENELTRTPLLFVDTAGAAYCEELEPDGESRRNVPEAELVLRQVQELLAAGIEPGQIAVIAPYAAQVRLLRELLQEQGACQGSELPHARAAVEIDTVDGFQGREKEAVVISMVRSNPEGEIGFLADVRRMNVALTRARRKLIVIGDSATIGGHEFYVRLLTHFEQQGAYRSVWEINP